MWVPPTVSRELYEERLEYEQVVQLMLECDQPNDELNRAVAQVDPGLAVVRAKPTVRTGFPLKPGFWHLIRRNQGAPLTVEVIQGPNEEFVEPSPDRLVQMLHERDLQNPAVVREMVRRKEEQQRLAEVEKQRVRAERDEEVSDRLLAATRTFVSLSPDVPWTQAHAGRRGRKKG